MDYSLRDFARFVTRLKAEDGKPLKLETHERKILAGYFDGVTETVTVIPKKNGKTTLSAALALYHLDRRPDADVFIAATSIRQARILFRQAAAMVMRSDLPRFEVKSGYGEIRLKGDRQRVGPRIQVISSEAGTEDGVRPTLALVDELHRARDGDLYGVLRDGLAPGGQMLTISTAGWDLSSSLGKLRKQAHALPNFTRVGVYNHACVGRSFEWHEWCLLPDDDLSVMRLVKRANPASWHTIPELRRRYESPTMTPAQWARFACGVWTAGEDPFIAPGVWERLKVDIGGVAEGDEVWVAVRTVRSGTGIGIASPRGESVAVAMEMLPYGLRDLEAALRRLEERYDVQRIYTDENQLGMASELLETSGLPFADLPTRAQRLMRATATFLGLVQDGNLVHDGDPALAEQVQAAKFTESTTGAYLAPTPETTGLVAVVLAVHEASRGTPEPMIVLPRSVG